MDRVRHARVAAVLVAVSASPAQADHEHHHHHHEPEGIAVSASLGAVAATYESPLYMGEYAGATVGATVGTGRLVVAATVAAYHIERNGRTTGGLGDVMVHGMASVITRGPLTLGPQLGIMAPTGDDDKGLGMGHVMLMGGAWGVLATESGLLAMNLGYARGIGGAGDHAEHAPSGPLVAPMAFSELYGDAALLANLATGLAAGVRGSLAIPTTAAPTRATGGIRVQWQAGRVVTTADLDAGLAGDPFGMRGTVATAVSF
jgi:hypothetical protein